ncbi:MAG: FMN-binding protein [Candidatus Abawacabacteria bacterium]|nr:FMN-binding protein [Candidatus Abawacabacteria bacterium]
MKSKHPVQKAFSVAAFASLALNLTACATDTTLPQATVVPSVTSTPISTTPVPTVMTTPTAIVTPTAQNTSSTYKDGTYSVQGTYISPGGPESIAVKLTVQKGVVTDAEVIPAAVLPMSQRFQGEFVSGYKQLVIGKSIDELNLGRVSGSSLTPKGFNDAVAKIKAQARS